MLALLKAHFFTNELPTVEEKKKCRGICVKYFHIKKAPQAIGACEAMLFIL
jgi:hypothetical protein